MKYNVKEVTGFHLIYVILTYILINFNLSYSADISIKTTSLILIS